MNDPQSLVKLMHNGVKKQVFAKSLQDLTVAITDKYEAIRGHHYDIVVQTNDGEEMRIMTNSDFLNTPQELSPTIPVNNNPNVFFIYYLVSIIAPYSFAAALYSSASLFCPSSVAISYIQYKIIGFFISSQPFLKMSSACSGLPANHIL